MQETSKERERRVKKRRALTLSLLRLCRSLYWWSSLGGIKGQTLSVSWMLLRLGALGVTE